MNILKVIIALSFLALFSPDVVAKKPSKPPDPDPVDIGSLCADSNSFFPAFAYVFTGELFLSNSDGDCSISIYQENEVISGIPSSISYRFFGDTEDRDGYGKIVWSERHIDFKLGGFTRSKVLLLEFQVEAGAITTSFPLTPRLILQEPENFGNVFAPDLSPAGDEIIVSAYETGEGQGYIWEFDIPENGTVATEEDVRVLTTLTANETQGLEYATFHSPLYGLIDQPQRVYFGYDYPDRKISYIEKGAGDVWSAPTLIAERWDGDLGPGSVGLWDFGSGLREVLAFSNIVNGIDMIEVLDVDACVQGSENCVVEGIEGWESASFTTFTEGQLPALLYLFDVDARNVGYSIRECDLTSTLNSSTTCFRTVIDGIRNPKRTLYGVNSAD